MKRIYLAREQNPLTKLPGNRMINDFIEDALREENADYTLVYFDFNNFKAFNDKYGFRQGDRAILLFADILSKATQINRFFIGHIGGDDFKALYDLEDRERGYIISSDREDNVRRFPIMDIVACIIYLPRNRKGVTAEGLSSTIAGLKGHAKRSDEKIAFYNIKGNGIMGQATSIGSLNIVSGLDSNSHEVQS